MPQAIANTDRVIVPLDAVTPARARALIRALGPDVWGFKLNDLYHHPDGPALLDSGNGPAQPMDSQDCLPHPTRWFLDLKLHDIPATVGNTARRLAERFAPAFLTVHASGGRAMLAAAVEAVAATPTRVLAVTVLTSLDASTAEALFGRPPEVVVIALAQLAADAGCHGIVCSAAELDALADLPLIKVVPGIRPAWYLAEHGAAARHDQARVATPAEALGAGADYLVIGRPISGAPDAKLALTRTLAELPPALPPAPPQAPPPAP